MKSLLTYINPSKAFNPEHQMAVKIQIDNSRLLGWAPDDILLATNFPFEYKGISALVLPDILYCTYHWPGTKIYVINHLLSHGLLEPDTTYWYHDFDCFQLAAMDDPLVADLGLTNYGRMPRLCSASMFFKTTAKDIFQRLQLLMDMTRAGEEPALSRMLHIDKALQSRVQHLNITYAFHRFNVQNCYLAAEKPIKAAHFHLTPDKYAFYVKGENKLGRSLIPPSLVKVFHHHGFVMKGV